MRRVPTLAQDRETQHGREVTHASIAPPDALPLRCEESIWSRNRRLAGFLRSQKEPNTTATPAALLGDAQ